MKEHIQLANAHVNQTTVKGVKTDWSIEENITNERLGILPKSLTDGQVFSILNFARKFELKAFNAGIVFGKQKQREADAETIKVLKGNLELAGKENERIAEALDIITKANQ